MKQKRLEQEKEDRINKQSRPKRKSTESVFPIECLFCEKEEGDLSKMSKKQRQSNKLHAAGEYHTSLQNPNIRHVTDLTSSWKTMATALCDTKILSKLNYDVRANELHYHGKCSKNFEYRYETLKKKKENLTEAEEIVKAKALERTIVYLKQLPLNDPKCQIEVRSLLDMYNKSLEEEGINIERNITRFGEAILSGTIEFEIHKNSHKVNVLTHKTNFLKTVKSDDPFDCSMFIPIH